MISHLFRTYFLARQRKPLLASCKITYSCNLSCLPCPFHCLPDQKDPSFEQVKSILDQLRDRGNRIVIFEGGEPLLWKDGEHDIRDVLLEARKRFETVGITTNGTLPLEDIPADIIWVSLDGLRDTHNKLRGARVFDQILENIHCSTHPRIYAHVTINNWNWTEIPELIRHLSGLVKGITVQLYYPYNQKDNLFLPLDRRAIVLDRLIQMKQKRFPILNSVASLRALQHNRWKCDDWLIDNANPDGTLSQGCYLTGRARIDCTRCGFSPHTEASLAFQGNMQAVLAGYKIFF